MTVIDEENASAEYDDMELVEFLEFLVRIAFHKNMDDSPMSNKLADLLKEIIGLTQVVFIDPPKTHTMQTQASDDDMKQFKNFIRQKSLLMDSV